MQPNITFPSVKINPAEVFVYADYIKKVENNSK